MRSPPSLRTTALLSTRATRNQREIWYMKSYKNGPLCVSSVYFKDTGVQPHLSVGLTSVRQKGGLPGLPPVTVPA